MPRTLALPKYRKHKHKHKQQAVVTLNGKDLHLGPYGSKVSILKYDRLVAEWLASGRTNRQEAESITISELTAEYTKYAKKHYRKHGRDTGTWENQKPLLKMFQAMYGDTLVEEFGPLKLKAFRVVLCKEREIQHGDRTEIKVPTRSYVNQQVQTLRRVFRWGGVRGIGAGRSCNRPRNRFRTPSRSGGSSRIQRGSPCFRPRC